MSTRERKLGASTLAIAAITAALGVYVYVVEIRGGEAHEKQTHAQTHLLPFEPEAATSLTIERAGERIECRKKGDVWRVVAPIQDRADDTTISRLLKDVAEANIDRTVSGNSLTPYGLDHPVRMTVGSAAAEASFEIGKENPTSSFVFARRGLAGSPVLLVERKVKDVAEKKLYDLREKEVLDFSPEDVTRIRFTNRGHDTLLVRGAQLGSDNQHSEWKLLEPRKVRADRGEVERSLNLCSYVRAESFVAEKPTDLVPYGLDHPWGQVRYDLKGGHSQTVVLGRSTVDGALTRYFARRSEGGPVFTVNDNLPRDTQRPAGEWEERHLADFNRPDVTELRLIWPEHSVVCAKSDKTDTWGLAEFKGTVAESMDLGAAARMPTARPADQSRLNDLLGHITAIQAKSFAEGSGPKDPRFSLMKPSLKVVALDKAHKPLATVSFGGKAGQLVYATSPYLGRVITVPSADVDRFQTSLRELGANGK